MSEALASLLKRVRACQLCESELQFGARPVLQASASARVLIAAQAPGSKVHETGIPFDDPSGDRLRTWMGIDKDTFYDASKIAILPMGFCYPGKGSSGDLPPLPRCAKTWREALLEKLGQIQLTLVVGQYAQAWHWPSTHRSVTETVKDWSSKGSATIPLPHPSPRNNHWMKINPWFELELLPVVRSRISAVLDST